MYDFSRPKVERLISNNVDMRAEHCPISEQKADVRGLGMSVGKNIKRGREEMGDSMKAYRSGIGIDPKIRRVSTPLSAVLPTCLIQLKMIRQFGIQERVYYGYN
jgi:hypothetical protein